MYWLLWQNLLQVSRGPAQGDLKLTGVVYGFSTVFLMGCLRSLFWILGQHAELCPCYLAASQYQFLEVLVVQAAVMVQVWCYTICHNQPCTSPLQQHPWHEASCGLAAVGGANSSGGVWRVVVVQVDNVRSFLGNLYSSFCFTIGLMELMAGGNALKARCGGETPELRTLELWHIVEQTWSGIP